MGEKKSRMLLSLFLSFFKIGAFTFGGGYAMIALIENEFVTNKKALSREDFLDMIAIAESTPGPIAINSATYIGYKTAGFWGSFFSTLAVVLPSLVIIYVISLFFDRFLTIKYVAMAFKGIQACVIYLILSAGIKTFKSLKKSAFSYVIVFTVTAVMITLSLLAVSFSSIYIILICGILGIFVYLLRRIKAKEGGNK